MKHEKHLGIGKVIPLKAKVTRTVSILKLNASHGSMLPSKSTPLPVKLQ